MSVTVDVLCLKAIILFENGLKVIMLQYVFCVNSLFENRLEQATVQLDNGLEVFPKIIFFSRFNMQNTIQE